MGGELREVRHACSGIPLGDRPSPPVHRQFQQRRCSRRGGGSCGVQRPRDHRDVLPYLWCGAKAFGVRVADLDTSDTKSGVTAARDARMAQFQIVRWSTHSGPESHQTVRRPRRKPHAFHGVSSGGQGRNRTIDTRIFSTTESPVRREQAEDWKGISAGPTEPPRPTEPIPNRQREKPPWSRIGPARSTDLAHRDRTFSDPRKHTPLHGNGRLD